VPVLTVNIFFEPIISFNDFIYSSIKNFDSLSGVSYDFKRFIASKKCTKIKSPQFEGLKNNYFSDMNG
jgi:hypothetical protein